MGNHVTASHPTGRLRHLPNALTGLRIALVPAVSALVLIDTAPARLAALVLFILASATDWLDGYAARRLGATSDVGRMLDPIADKLLVVAVLVVLIAVDRIAGLAVAAALLIMLREFLVGGVREFLAGIGAAGLPSTPLAKWKTAVQMAALVLLIIGGDVASSLPLSVIGVATLWLAAALATITGVDYVVKAGAQLRARS